MAPPLGHVYRARRAYRSVELDPLVRRLSTPWPDHKEEIASMRTPSSMWHPAATVGATIVLIAQPIFAGATIHFATTYQTIPSVVSCQSVKALHVDGDGILDLVVLGSSKAIWFHRGLPGGGYAPVSPLVSFPGVVSLWDAGDINNDGRLDLVAVDVTNTAWSALGNGDGTFQAPRAILTSFWGRCLKLADLDADGRLDAVAVAVYGPLYTMKGLGDGRFQLTSTMSLPQAYPVDMAIADLDGDSRLDVLVTDQTPSSLRFFRGLPGGLLDLPVGVPMPGTPYSVTVGDLDEDGLWDAMVINSGIGPNIASVVYGARSGPPFERVDLVADGARTIAAADLDGDGHPELLAAEFNVHGDQIEVFRRTGSRTFAAVRNYAGGVQSLSTVFVDATGDGLRDIVVCNPPRSQLVVLRGHGGLSFGDGEEVRTVSRISGLDVGDVNGDRIPDVVTVQQGSAGVAGVHLGAGDGAFLPMSTTIGPIACCDHESAALADLNSDGSLDLIGLMGSSARLDIVLGDGLGHFAAGSSRSLGSEPHSSMVLTEFNGDGRLDAAIACDAGIAICLGTPGGGLGAPAFLAGSEKFVATADFNRDGHADLIATNSAVDFEFGSQIIVYLGGGDGTFAPLPTFYGGYKPTTFAVGDVNSDGIPDLAIGNNGDRTIAIFLGVGDGTFVAGTVFPEARAAAIEFADVDSDGALDLIATMPDSAYVRVWPGLAGGVFGSPIAFGTRSYPGILRVADLDRDGGLDIVVGHTYRDIFDVLMNESPSYPVPTLVSNVEAHVRAGHVRIVWYSVAPELRLARVERSSPGGWRDVGAIRSDSPDFATFEEDVADGEYDYRIALNLGGEVIRAGDVHVSVRTTASLAIEACRWDASAGAFSATLSLMSPSVARIQIFDVLGRVVMDDRWTPAAVGIQAHTFGARARVADGVYWARLSQEDQAVTRRVLVLE